MMDAVKTVELVNSALSVITILLCFGVVFLFDHAARKSLKNKIKTSEEWLIIGIYFVFLSISLDHIYTLVARTASFFDSDNAQTILDSRIFFSVIFKQCLSIFSSYALIRSVLAYKNEKHRKKEVDFIFRLCLFLGVAYGVFVVLIKRTL